MSAGPETAGLAGVGGWVERLVTAVPAGLLGYVGRAGDGGAGGGGGLGGAPGDGGAGPTLGERIVDQTARILGGQRTPEPATMVAVTADARRTDR